VSFLLKHLPDFVATLIGLVAIWYTFHRLPLRARTAAILTAAGWLCLGAGLLLRSSRISAMLPLVVSDIVRRTSFLLLLTGLGAAITLLVLQALPKPRSHHSPGRRQFLNAARMAVVASPFAVTGYGVFIQRDDFRLKEIDLPIPRLDPALAGLRLVQVSDVHLSAFLSRKELARVIDMANGTRAHLALMTGDLITSYRDPLDECIRELARLRADAGVIGCLGNHEEYAQVEDYTTAHAARYGIRFLRNRSEVFQFSGEPICFAGVDYQPMQSEYLPGAERLVTPGMPNILLSHNPDVFPVAAQKGFDATISGHTHGGQITVEILNQNVSVARFYTPYVYGLYRERGASAYVTRGIGTVGVPARLGAPPEVALIRLCAI
jgi:predicted MPP superfamily phosphohydrolase